MQEQQKQPPRPVKTNNYHWAIRFSFFIGIGLAVPLIILHHLTFGDEMPQWLIDLLTAAIWYEFVSKLVSGTGYIAQIGDVLSGEKTLVEWLREKELGKTLKNTLLSLKSRLSWRAVGLFIGGAAAIIFIGLELGFHTAFTFASIISPPVAGIIAFVGLAGKMCGLGNRSGRFVDIMLQARKNHFRAEEINYALGLFCCLLIGIAVMTFVIMTGAASGGIVPTVLLAIGITSSFASGGGYIGRVADLFLGPATLFHTIKDIATGKFDKKAFKKDFWERCTEERVMTTIGVAIGIALGVTLVIAGVGTLPFFGVGAPKIVAGIMVICACTSLSGGICNRVGAARIFSTIASGVKNAVGSVVASLTHGLGLFKTAVKTPKPSPPALLSVSTQKTPLVSPAKIITTAAPSPAPVLPPHSLPVLFPTSSQKKLNHRPGRAASLEEPRTNRNSIY